MLSAHQVNRAYQSIAVETSLVLTVRTDAEDTDFYSKHTITINQIQRSQKSVIYRQKNSSSTTVNDKRVANQQEDIQ